MGENTDIITDGDTITWEETHITLHQGQGLSRHPATPGPAPMPPGSYNPQVPEPAPWRRTRRIRGS